MFDKIVSASMSFNGFLSFLLAINAYLEIPLGISGAFYIPSFFLIIVVLFCFAINYMVFCNEDYVFIGAIFVFCFISAILAPNFDDVRSRFFSVAQMLTSIISFVVTIKLLRSFDMSKRYSGMMWCLIIIIILTALEKFTGFKEISDAFRNVAYASGNYVAYSEDLRDIAMTGGIRPKVFTSEPSLVAVPFLVLSISLIFSTNQKVRIYTIFCLVLIQYGLLQSPILLLFIPLFIIRLTPNRSVMAVGILLSLFFVMVLPVITNFFDDSLSRFTDSDIFFDRGGDTVETQSSEALRLVNPYLAIVDVFSVNPITGLGIGGKRSLSIYSTYFSDHVVAFGNNAFATIWIFFGIFGGFIFLFILYKYLASIGLYSKYLIVTAFLVMQTMGGFESARFWVFMAVLCVSIGEKQSSRI